MDFVRKRLTGAEPRFAIRRDSMGGLMVALSKLAEQGIDHPDMRLIAAAPGTARSGKTGVRGFERTHRASPLLCRARLSGHRRASHSNLPRAGNRGAMKSYKPKPGDLILMPDQNAGIVTHVRGTLASVISCMGLWYAFQAEQLVPYITNAPRPEVANFASLVAGIESFAPGFRASSRVLHELPADQDEEAKRLIETIANEEEDEQRIADAAARLLAKIDAAQTPMETTNHD